MVSSSNWEMRFSPAFWYSIEGGLDALGDAFVFFPSDAGELLGAIALRRRGHGSEADVDSLGATLLVIAQHPRRSDCDLIDLGRQRVARDDYSITTSHGQATGPFARNIIRVPDGEPAFAANWRFEMEDVPRMFLDGHVEPSSDQRRRHAINRDQKTFRIQRPGHLPIASQPLGTVRAWKTADQGRRSCVRVSSVKLTS